MYQAINAGNINKEDWCKDMEILREFRFYFPNLGLVDKDGVIRLRIIGLQVSLVKTREITLYFIMKLDFLFIKP